MLKFYFKATYNFLRDLAVLLAVILVILVLSIALSIFVGLIFKAAVTGGYLIMTYFGGDLYVAKYVLASVVASILFILCVIKIKKDASVLKNNYEDFADK